MPEEREGWPRGHHPEPRNHADEQRDQASDRPQHWLDRQPQRLAIDDYGASGELVEPRRLQQHERAVQDAEGQNREDDQEIGLEVQRLPEHVAEAERSEPE